ncbi:hypothetical protein, partial [Ruminococcus flavefaciens]|uniref:hypothetical protein n=1 Tax=Ruminococcus flavefaciens TaxID=1265 RepID=UPI0026F1E796
LVYFYYTTLSNKRGAFQNYWIIFCTLFCPTGQNELDIKECDAQILYNLRPLNKVQGNNRLTAVIEDTLFIF